MKHLILILLTTVVCYSQDLTTNYIINDFNAARKNLKEYSINKSIIELDSTLKNNFDKSKKVVYSEQLSQTAKKLSKLSTEDYLKYIKENNIRGFYIEAENYMYVVPLIILENNSGTISYMRELLLDKYITTIGIAYQFDVLTDKYQYTIIVE